MNTLASILASAIGGPYQNDRPMEPPPMAMPPAAMLPPGFQMQPEAPAFPPMTGPSGEVWNPQDGSNPRAMPIPRFHRLNPGRPNEWRDIET